jgi:hypothetical protein
MSELRKAEEEREAILIEDEESIEEYYELREQLKQLELDFKDVITHPTYSLPFLNAGRLVEVKDGDKDFGIGVVVAYNKVINPKVSDLNRRGVDVDVLIIPGPTTCGHRERPASEVVYRRCPPQSRIQLYRTSRSQLERYLPSFRGRRRGSCHHRRPAIDYPVHQPYSCASAQRPETAGREEHGLQGRRRSQEEVPGWVDVVGPCQEYGHQG